jgi:hypothetical protein
VICESQFIPRRKVDKTCGLDCQIQYRRKLSRERAQRYYTPRALRPDTTCEGCGRTIRVSKTGPMPRWCTDCRARKEDQRARDRMAVRRCHKCNMALPDARRRPGVAVCDSCRVDPRKHRLAHEQRRRLRRYGIVQDDYDRKFQEQDGRCAACRTDMPGIKGWCIDHCHKTGRFRAILCMRCNTVIGLVDEDPGMLRALAGFVELLREQSEIKI